MGGGEDLRHERRAKRLALAVDVGVVRAREVDALEGAGAGCGVDGRTKFGHQNFAIRGNDQRRTGRKLLHRLRRHVERGLDRGALAGHHEHLVVAVVVAGAYAVRVARREGPAVARRPAERPCAVGVGKGGGECLGHVVI